MNVLKEIGRGGFGIVEEVIDDEGNHYALKTFSVNQPAGFSVEMTDNVRKRFVREADVQSELQHRNIVPVLSKYLQNEPPSFLMPLAVSSLDKDIQQDRTLGGNFITALMDILAGLEELHSMGIFHRDLKPQNVLRIHNEDEEVYAISDFGLMSVNDTQLSQITHTGMRMGSDYYTAPEIVADLRQATSCSDIYSVGCILHDFVGTGVRIPCNEINDDQGNYADILRACTRKEPGRRFQSITDLREAILAISSSAEAPVTIEAKDFITNLQSDTPLPREVWLGIITYLEDHVGTQDSNLILGNISLSKISQLIELDNTLAARLGIEYARWTRDGTFDFSACDGIANRVEAFFEVDDISCKADLLLALLYMGTSHNRWYVEHKFMHMSGTELPENIAKRLALEIRVEAKSGACQALKHLTRSVNADLGKLHPIVSNTIQKVC